MKCIGSEKKLEEIIIEQHAGLMGNDVKAKEIKRIIHGQTEKVLVLLDSYEHAPRTNEDIEKAIRKQSLRNCCIIITSRETKEQQDIRKYMDAEAEITGFDKKKIEDYVAKYLGDKDKYDKFMRTVKKTNIFRNWFGKFIEDDHTIRYDHGILRIPFFLHMVCVLFVHKSSLPKTRTGIISEIVKRCPDWVQIRKTGQKKSKSLDSVAVKMGEFLLKRLLRGEKQHVFTKVIR